MPNRHKIELGQFDNRSIHSLSGWDTIMRLQFENLVWHNRQAIQKSLHIFLETVVFDNPYFQYGTKTGPVCQIDYMIQTAHHFLYVCEIKFLDKPVGLEVISSMKEKMQKIQFPKHFSLYPILIHASGVQKSVIESGFFSKIIDFGTLLE